jgi:hypothetical protein
MVNYLICQFSQVENFLKSWIVDTLREPSTVPRVDIPRFLILTFVYLFCFLLFVYFYSFFWPDTFTFWTIVLYYIVDNLF